MLFFRPGSINGSGMQESDFFLTTPSFSRIAGLVHGFGTRRLTWEGLGSFPRLQGMRPVRMRQIHSDIVINVEDAPGTWPEGDALISRTPGLLLCVRTADCLPLLIVDEKVRAAAAVHCGWRGTAKKLAAKVVEAMRDRFSCRPGELRAVLGPSIGGACYEVGGDVPAEFRLSGDAAESLFAPAGDGKYLLDLTRANRMQLQEAGVPEAHIESLDVCTHCEDRFLSYRRDRGECGRLVNFLGFRERKI